MATKLIISFVLLGFLAIGQVHAADTSADKDVFPVDKVTVSFDRPDVAAMAPPSERIDLSEIMNLRVDTLGYVETKDGRRAYAKYTTGEAAPLTVAELSKGGLKYFRSSGLLQVTDRIRKYINAKGFVVVRVAPDPDEMNLDSIPNTDSRAKSRPAHPNNLDIKIYLGVVSEVRAIASGNRIAKDDVHVNNPLHRATTQQSPISPKPGESLVRKELLDQYIFYLNRHPGRRVDIAVSQAVAKPDPNRPGHDLVGDIVLDYLIAENKPWSVIVQGSNTGTAQTSQWRERFGYTNNQFTNHDDILSLSYTTSSFDQKSQEVDLAYDAPFPKVQKLRWKIYGSYEAFTASDLGTGAENFIGEQENGAGELTLNVWQPTRDIFVDLFSGGQYSHIRANLNPIGGSNSTGGADIFEPYLGVRAERDSDIATTVGSLTFRYGFPFDRTTSAPAGTSEGASGLNQLGRADVNANFPLLQADVTQSFFLEPIFNPGAFEPGNQVAAPTTPGQKNYSTLAHEVVFSARGQTSFGERLVPQEQEAVGGLYSVRGYPESFVAGDTVLIGSAEYRLHVPRLFAPNPSPSALPLIGNFRWTPQQQFGRPDWDMICRGFLDMGYAHSYSNGTTVGGESDQFLVGTGVGMEFQFSPDEWPTIDIRTDYGIALRSADSGPQHVSPGSQRFSFVFTLLY